MNVLFLSYWSLREPLTSAAIFPYLRLLAAREDIGEIHLVTLETTSGYLPTVDLDIPKVTLHQVRPRLKRFFIISKVLLHLSALWAIVRLVLFRKVELIFAKASMAGAIAHIVHLITGIPYIVESYEPHSTYMLECGVWRKNGLRYRFSHFMESVQLRHARNIITVTHNHRHDLIAAGRPSTQVKVVPSITDLSLFVYRPEERAKVRKELGIPEDATVGIYVGKFGGLYLDHEAFFIFARTIEHFRNTHILVLSPSDPTQIRTNALEAGIPEELFHVLIAKHVDVPRYLSASDLAFSTIKYSPVKRYQCPIKNGEYWACGLPILMTDGIADDHLLMRQGIGGSVFNPDLSDLHGSLLAIQGILQDEGHKAAMRHLAEEYRSIRIAAKVYDEILGPGSRKLETSRDRP